MSKYVFFTGGVVSGLGKGITAASLGALFKSRGYSVAVLRFNPFFNIDSFNLSPRLHGEIYITKDGKACDLVVGHYERIMGQSLHAHSDITSGEIYSRVIYNERQNLFDGCTVQVVPHITDEIKNCVLLTGNSQDIQPDIVIVEVGGTVGDIETQPYLEAIRQLRSDLGKNNVAYVHVSLVNYIEVSGEQKTKPTQHSVKELQNLGIRPDVIICRTDYPLEQSSRNKLSLFCNVEKDCIIENTLNENIYEIPVKLENEGLCKVVLRHLRLEDRPSDLAKLHALNEKISAAKNGERAVKIGIVSRFIKKLNAHISLREALHLSAANKGVRVDFVEICNPEIDFSAVRDLDGLIVTEGAVLDDVADYKNEFKLIEYAKNNDLPLLLIDKACFLAVFDQDTGPLANSAHKVKQNKTRAVSTDLDINADEDDFKLKVAEKCAAKCSQINQNKRLGERKTNIIKGTTMHTIYGDSCFERHNKDLSTDRGFFDEAGYVVSGISDDMTVDAFELKGHRFFLGVMFHPEFSARADRTNKLIDKFIDESIKERKKIIKFSSIKR